SNIDEPVVRRKKELSDSNFVRASRCCFQSAMHILVAETNTSFLDEIKHALEQEGHTVLAATNGMQAWTQLTDNTAPDLVVTRCHLGAGMPPGTALGLYARS